MDNSHDTQIRKLEEAVKDVRNLSEEGFFEIAAIARLALLSLETPEGHSDTENIAMVLSAIANNASMVLETIRSCTESAGYSVFNQRAERRLEAWRAWRKQMRNPASAL